MNSHKWVSRIKERLPLRKETVFVARLLKHAKTEPTPAKFFITPQDPHKPLVVFPGSSHKMQLMRAKTQSTSIVGSNGTLNACVDRKERSLPVLEIIS